MSERVLLMVVEETLVKVVVVTEELVVGEFEGVVMERELSVEAEELPIVYGRLVVDVVL